MADPCKDGVRLVEGFGADRFRVKAAIRNGARAVKLELLAPLTAHTPGTLATVGRALVIPLDRLTPLIEALDAVRREMLEAGQ